MTTAIFGSWFRVGTTYQPADVRRWVAGYRPRADAALHDALSALIESGDDTAPDAADRALLAVVDLPYAMIKRYLSVGRQIPDHAPEFAEQAAAALFAMRYS